MNRLYEPHPTNSFQLLCQAASVLVIVMGGLALVGWALDLETLKSDLPGMAAMNPGGAAVASWRGDCCRPRS